MAGMYFPGGEQPKKAPNAFGNPQTYNAAVEQQGGDYDKIMGNYDDLLNSQKAGAAKSPLSFAPITPQLAKYSQSPELTSALSNYSGMTQSGGYTPEGIANIRARGISPIRSIYSSAQQGLDRTKSLQGGYSPGHTAATTKMAREMSEQIAGRTTDVEAGIAQNVAQNRLSAMSNYAPLEASANRERMAFESANTDRTNRASEFNAEMPLKYQQANQDINNQQLNTIEGMRGLYGTTPALVNTFGNQVSQNVNAGQNQQQIDDQRIAERNRTGMGFAQMGMRR